MRKTHKNNEKRKAVQDKLGIDPDYTAGGFL